MSDVFLTDGVWLRLTWQSTAWLLAGLAASFIFRRRPARAHAAMVVALAGLFVTPFADLTVSQLGLGQLQPPSAPSSVSGLSLEAPAEFPSGPFDVESFVATEQPSMPAEPSSVDDTPASVAQPRSAELPFRATLPGVLSAVWMLMSAALAARMALAAGRARRLVAGKDLVAAGHLQRCLTEAAARIELGVPPVLGMAAIRSPIVWCWGRSPTVLVPMDAEATGEGIDWVGVFRHELAHWKRKDHLTGILAQAAIVLLPWNPLTWWAARRLHELSEQACDQWAVADGRSPLDFAESLLSLHPENRQRAALAAVSSGRLLAVRVRRLLKCEPAEPRAGRTWTAVVLGMSLLTVAALALSQDAPARSQEQSSTPSEKPSAPEAAVAADPDAELHVIGIYGPKGALVGKRKHVEVTVRPTPRPVVLVLTAYDPVEWRVQLAEGARLKQVIVSGYRAQEITGLPENVPFVNEIGSFHDGKPGKDGWSYAYQWNTLEYRRMVEDLNERTGLLVSTAQLEESGNAFVVDGKQGRNYAQKERRPRPTLPAEPTPDELLALSKDADVHAVGVYEAAAGNGAPIDVDVRPTGRPVVLVLTSYYSVLWQVKVAEGAQLKAVVIGGYFEQEFEGIPDSVPIVSRTYFPAQRRDYFHAYRWNTSDYRRMVEKLNDMTGRLVSTYQPEYRGTSFIIDGVRGGKYAQKERKPRRALPTEPTPEELLATAKGAELHVVGTYLPDGGHGAPVEVEVRPTGKPIVLVMSSYGSVLWNVKVAEGAQLKAVIICGYNEQEFEGIPEGVPIVSRTFFPTRQPNWFYGYNDDSLRKEYQDLLSKLKEMTGLQVSTSQGANPGISFVVDGTRVTELDRKAKAADATKARDDEDRPPKAAADPLADVADIPSQELQAGGDANKRYLLIGPRENAVEPADGYGLVVIMPGGDGSADFHPFVKRIFKNSLTHRYLAVQPIAIKWSPDQQIVWPTKMNPVAGMKFSTEEFVEAVIEDAAKKHKLDRAKIFSLSWSSSGPAAYAISLQDKSAITGSLIAMSVFKPNLLPPLGKAKDHAYFLYHSREDRVCPFRMAQQAEAELTKNGALVRLETYDGGHGWRGPVYDDIRQGIEWLEKNHEAVDGP